MKSNINVVLIGNPNTGKTSLFNQLTGLKQKVGNYPGVTVDKKQGTCKLPNGKTALITDLPGTYSINPTSLDESVVIKAILNNNKDTHPDIILVVAEVENLKRNLLLFSQIKELEIPVLLVINMADVMSQKGISINIKALEEKLNTEIILISSRKNSDVEKVKKGIANTYEKQNISSNESLLLKVNQTFFTELKTISQKEPLYKLWLFASQNYFPEDFPKDTKEEILKLSIDNEQIKRFQHKEAIYRYQEINKQIKNIYTVDTKNASDLRSKLDRIFTHKIFGYVIFLSLLAFIFQAIFEWSGIPMDFIDESFGNLSEYCKSALPEGKFTDLISEGIIPGIGGILIFVPQIVILFLFIAILEESGYMSRVVFIMDKIMRRFGLSGKSIFPLISGTACAIPAVMAARTISSWKERLITILVTPFITCGARLPVYAILIALVIPNKKVLGFLNLQGLTMLGLYTLGFVTAMVTSYILNKILKQDNKTFFVAEMPDYKIPSVKNIFYEVWDKTKAFILDAGKIILAISIILWFLASHGGKKFDNIENEITKNLSYQKLPEQERAQFISSVKLENSYIGIMGKTIEPVIKPLGYDWKIGIGLITSFAAREVFVGTLATIYSIEGVEDQGTIKERMANEINPKTGEKIFNFATGISLLLFYTFAMQCMATLAIVKRETKSWRWPIIQLIGMGLLAYITAFIAYQVLH